MNRHVGQREGVLERDVAQDRRRLVHLRQVLEQRPGDPVDQIVAQILVHDELVPEAVGRDVLVVVGLVLVGARGHLAEHPAAAAEIFLEGGFVDIGRDAQQTELPLRAELFDGRRADPRRANEDVDLAILHGLNSAVPGQAHLGVVLVRLEADGDPEHRHRHRRCAADRRADEDPLAFQVLEGLDPGIGPYQVMPDARPVGGDEPDVGGRLLGDVGRLLVHAGAAAQPWRDHRRQRLEVDLAPAKLEGRPRQRLPFVDLHVYPRLLLQDIGQHHEQRVVDPAHAGGVGLQDALCRRRVGARREGRRNRRRRYFRDDSTTHGRPPRACLPTMGHHVCTAQPRSTRRPARPTA